MKIGIDIGGSHVAIGLINENGKIIAKEDKDLNNDLQSKDYCKKLVDTIIELISKILEENKIDIKGIKLIGIAIPGTVSDTHIIKAKNLHIKDFNIVSEINKYFNIPIVLRNDAKCAAIAENAYGCLKQYNRSIFLTLGTGIGGAVIINDKLLDTGNLPGCEFGHMTIEKDGILCECGKKGCFERYASMKALKNNLRKALGYDEKVSGNELFEIIRSNTKENKDYKIIETIVEEYIKNLATGIANLINIFEPEAIGIGGSFVYFEEVLLKRLEKELLSNNILFNPREEIVIKTALLKNDAGMIGAIL